MRTEQSFGVIPIRDTPAGRLYLLVRHAAGHWGFPKGKQEPGETPMQTATRELREETGIADARIVASPAFTETYRFTKKSGGVVDKAVTYYLGYVDREAVTVMPGELLDHAWLDAAGAAARLTYPESRQLLEAVQTHLAAAT